MCVLYAYDYSKEQWISVWSIFNNPQYKTNSQACDRSLPLKASRKFEPNLTRKHIFTDLIRIEFEHSKLEYYTELDAIEITGLSYDLPNVSVIAANLQKTADIFENLDEPLEKAISNDQVTLTHLKPFKLELGHSNMFDKESVQLSKSDESTRHENAITQLPSEILCMVLNYLDLKTIFRMRSTCKVFYELSNFYFTHLNDRLDLQPYWHHVSHTTTSFGIVI